LKKHFEKMVGKNCVFLLMLFLFANADAQKLQLMQLPVKSAVRAIEVINDSTVWFAGSRGIFGYTIDNGRHWTIDSARINALVPDFRSISVTSDDAVFLLNSGSPAYLIKSTDQGKTWNTVYANSDKNIFFDSMKFADNKNGFAIADPINGCFFMIATHDGGETWDKISCSLLPPAEKGEACFASSNSCIALYKNHVWLATGGAAARVLTSADNGKKWFAYETPVIHGGEFSGIFSIDFYDEKTGIIAGGNYENKTTNENTRAITKDGGKRWSIAGNGKPPGFISCVQYQPHSAGKILLAASLPGIFISTNGGKSWEPVNDTNGNPATANYYTLRFSPSGNVAWLAGAEGAIAKIIFR
jgi:photosystem II stability/assembly factor-like uncharacterized protein